MNVTKQMVIFGGVALIAIILLSIAAFAIGNQAPCPVNGMVDPAFANWEVKITRMASGTTRTVYTGSSGFFSMDWANVEAYNNGDEFKVQIQDKVYTTFHNGVAVEFGTISAIGLDAPCQTTICETSPPCEVCEECLEPQECEPVTETNWEAILAAIGITGVGAYLVGGKIKINKKGMEGILLAMKPGQGVKVAKGYTGSGKFLHMHKGVSGYHDPITNHTKLEAKHEDYEFPNGV